MKIAGSCDFCSAQGTWEALFFRRPESVHKRPPETAAIFPLDLEFLPAGCTFDPADLQTYDVRTAVACPECCRKEGSLVIVEPKEEQRRKEEDLVVAEPKEGQQQYIYHCHFCGHETIVSSKLLPPVWACERCGKNMRPLYGLKDASIEELSTLSVETEEDDASEPTRT